MNENFIFFFVIGVLILIIPFAYLGDKHGWKWRRIWLKKIFGKKLSEADEKIIQKSARREFRYRITGLLISGIASVLLLFIYIISVFMQR